MPNLLYDFALSNLNLTISEKLLDRPVVLQASLVIVLQADFIG
ncbi:MAG: hypothetical protein PF485_06380 [Bacteroidales bacterium]|nr:hypothetical protein [Bacteroidales bacterium]